MMKENDDSVQFYRKYPMRRDLIPEIRDSAIAYARELGIYTSGCIRVVGKGEWRTLIIKIKGPALAIRKLEVHVNGYTESID